MTRLKIWLLIIGAILILLDKFSFIRNIRDYSSVYMQKQIQLIIYRIENYPRLIFLQKIEQQNLQKENILLKKQLEEYAILLKQKKNQGNDNKILESLRKIQLDLYNDFKICVARAIVDVNYLINNKLLIDQGSTNGIEIGNAVVNKEGVIGQINTVNQSNAQLILMTNTDFKIYLQHNETKSKMLAHGIGNNNLLVEYINKKDQIKPGDILVTTGLDDVYPANLPAVRVVRIFDENNGFNSAICEPVVDFNQLRYVLVLKNAN